MTVAAVILGALAVGLGLARPPDGSRRLARLQPRPAPGQVAMSAGVACAVAGGALVLVTGGAVGVVLGVLVTLVGPRALAGLEPASARREREQLAAELPLLADLLGACLSGGASLSRAATAVAAALPGPGGRRLSGVVDALAAGTPPEQAWHALAGGADDDPLAPAARLLARAGEGGTPVASALQRVSADARAASAAAGSEAARRVGVLVVAPLGLCFLPAFVLLGIVPVVAGLAAPLLRSF